MPAKKSAEAKSNGILLKIVLAAFTLAIGLGSFNAVTNSALNERVHANEIRQREGAADLRGDIKVIRVKVERIEKMVEQLSERREK